MVPAAAARRANDRPMPAEAVASAIVRAVERERYAVYPDRSLALLAALGPLAAPFLRRLVDRRVRRTRR